MTCPAGPEKHFNIYGDWVDNADEWVHCSMCHRLLTWSEWEYGECRCGADLRGDADKSILSGKALRLARESVDRQLTEWTALNRPVTSGRGEGATP